MDDRPFIEYCWVVLRVFCIFLGVTLFWSSLLFTMMVYAGDISKTEGLGKLLSFWEYWYGFVGACIGIAAAVFMERRAQKQKLERGREALKKSVAHNQNLIAETRGFLQNGGESYFKLDTPSLTMWLGFSADVIGVELFEEIQTFRHELEHINNKINTYAIYSSILRSQIPIGVDNVAKASARAAELGRLGILAHLNTESLRATRILLEM